MNLWFAWWKVRIFLFVVLPGWFFTSFTKEAWQEYLLQDFIKFMKERRQREE